MIKQRILALRKLQALPVPKEVEHELSLDFDSGAVNSFRLLWEVEDLLLMLEGKSFDSDYKRLYGISFNDTQRLARKLELEWLKLLAKSEREEIKGYLNALTKFLDFENKRIVLSNNRNERHELVEKVLTEEFELKRNLSIFEAVMLDCLRENNVPEKEAILLLLNRYRRYLFKEEAYDILLATLL